MKKINISFSLLLAALSAFTPVFGQIAEPGVPLSFKNSYLKSSDAIPHKTLEPIDINALEAEDLRDAIPNRYSVFETFEVDVRAEGVSTAVPEANGTIWRYRVEGENARSIQIFFSSYKLPDGAKVFIYNDERTALFGAFTERNNNARQSLMIADFPGNALTIEYFEPAESTFEGSLKIGAAGKAYKEFPKSGANVDEDGFININCSDGAPWQEEKHAVCRFNYRIGDNGYLCTGALINNVTNDGTPLFLTANHCLETEAAAATVTAWFNYEHIGCDGPLKQYSTLSGATLLATAEASDYTLLLFDDIPPADYQPYYAGWDVSGDPGTSQVGIHHPGGKPKKISIADVAATDYPEQIFWEGNTVSPESSHWEVLFNWGVTSGGSSGSPMFNEKGRIIGQLHGGSYEDYYGKLDYSWDTPSKTDFLLKHFLDPDETDTLAIDGYYPAENRPDPLFVPAFSNVCAATPVKLFGYSAFAPDSWSWSFTPGDVTFLQDTDAQSRNPVVAFNTASYYDVTLQAGNQAGDSSQTYQGGVNTLEGLRIEVFPVSGTDSCLYNFDSIALLATGAELFTWTLEEEMTNHFTLVQDSEDHVQLKMTSMPESSDTITINVTGFHGECSAQTTYSLPLILQTNDSIHKAIEIFTGQNGLFSNKCAGIEDAEPIPPVTSCTGQASWCDEYGTGEDIIENSVWFYFIPQDTGYYKLTSSGMDNQTAIYEAETAEELFEGNYTLIGANDDVTDLNYNAVIKRVLLNANQRYWIQADGSAGGSEGTFYLTMELLELLSSDPFYAENHLKIYPQPAADKVQIEWEHTTGSADTRLEIFGLAGSMVFSKLFSVQADQGIEISTADWENGVYFMRLMHGDKVYKGKIIK